MNIPQALTKLGIDASADKLSAFLDLFEKWNRSINLSAASSRGDLIGHLNDSLHVVPHLRDLVPGPSGGSPASAPTDRSISTGPATPTQRSTSIASTTPPARVLDVGSGGGFPVAIAAICLPDVAFTSLEPVHKKHAFIRTAARELELANLTALAERLEDHPAHDYDAAMSRATFDLREWLEAGRARVVGGGIVLGFEAIRRDDLPPTVERFPYTIDGKPRAIVVLRRGA
jgi:16S rRNA (guanine527-N7)-methyltransferase